VNLEKELYQKSAILDEQSKEIAVLRNHVRDLSERSMLAHSPSRDNQEFVLQRTVSVLKSEIKGRDDELMNLKASLQRVEASLLSKHSKGSSIDLSPEIEYLRGLIRSNVVGSHPSPVRSPAPVNSFVGQGSYLGDGFGISHQTIESSVPVGNSLGIHQASFTDQWGGFGDNSSELVGNFDGFQPFRASVSDPVVGNGYFYTGADGNDRFQSNGSRFS
jgi:hypothetical protein